jgi:hypothetical protein
MIRINNIVHLTTYYADASGHTAGGYLRQTYFKEIEFSIALRFLRTAHLVQAHRLVLTTMIPL